MKFTIDNELIILSNIWFHELAKTIAGNNYTDKWLTYIKTNKIGYLTSRIL